jgi:hypothetical protein
MDLATQALVTARQRAERARKRANDTHEATHGEASKAADFKPSADLKTLFREVAKRIHPDFAKDDAERQRRTRFMADANEAYSRGDAEALILGENTGWRVRPLFDYQFEDCIMLQQYQRKL